RRPGRAAYLRAWGPWRRHPPSKRHPVRHLARPLSGVAGGSRHAQEVVTRGTRGKKAMLSGAQVGAYLQNGFLTVENVVPMPLIEEARQAVEDFVERSRAVADHDDVFDLEPGHSADTPRVRRLKEPCAIHPIFDRINRLPQLL